MRLQALYEKFPRELSHPLTNNESRNGASALSLASVRSKPLDIRDKNEVDSGGAYILSHASSQEARG
jgi:hypothetical protein